MVKIAFCKKDVHEGEAIQVCDNLNPNLAMDSDTDTDNDFTDYDFIEEDWRLLHVHTCNVI